MFTENQANKSTRNTENGSYKSDDHVTWINF